MAPFDLLAFVRRYRYPLAASVLVACGVAVRLALTLIGWPHTNSEEGTMGLEAMHILLRGEHPIYFYGQNYMGAGEAYLGALAFRVFGISIVTLRLGMIFFYALFMVGVCWLAHLLYSRRVALVALVVLIFGTPFLMQIELLADGGKAETMAFGAMLFALASWLALSQPAGKELDRQRILRYAAFAGWGVIAGLGLYTYPIIAPFVLTSGVLLGGACWRELRGWVAAFPLVGLLIGLTPALIYTATMPIADNPVSVFLSLHQSLNAGGTSGLYLPVKQVVGTLLYTLPTVTGLINLYPVQALPLYGPLNASTFASVIIGGGWSLGYLALLAVATWRPLRALHQHWLQRPLRPMAKRASAGDDAQTTALSPFTTQQGARNLARLMLSLTAWLTIAAYMFSATAANNPHSGRYMIGLLVIVPAVLWPLVDWEPRKDVSKVGKGGAASQAWGATMRKGWRPIGVALLGASLALATIGMAQAVPADVVANQRDAKFAHDLLSHGVTRFYSDYWTCDLMTFVTRERLTCAVIREYAQPGLTRYPPYDASVQADPGAAYVLRHGSSIERTFLTHTTQGSQQYEMAYLFDGYAVYTPAAHRAPERETLTVSGSDAVRPPSRPIGHPPPCRERDIGRPAMPLGSDPS